MHRSSNSNDTSPTTPTLPGDSNIGEGDMNNAERVHLRFRGASEIAKALRAMSLACEFIAALLVLYSIFWKPANSYWWLSLTILLCTLFGLALRLYSNSINSFAQRCRRISLRAFCAGKDVELKTVALLDDDTPALTSFIAGRLPAKSLGEYYEPTVEEGALRHAELYAHSAFFTWRLLRWQAWITGILAILIAIVCVIVIFDLAANPASQAANPASQADRNSVLDAICSVILLVFFAKASEASWEAYTSLTEIRSIENKIIEDPTSSLLNELVDSYDIERAAGSNPMTILYRLRRGALSNAWKERRKVILEHSIPKKDQTK